MQCPHCSKEYKRENAFTRHVMCCKILSMKPKEREEECVSLNETPPLHQVYRLVQSLIVSENRLRKRVELLERCQKRADGRKEDVINWLSKNILPSQCFQSWVENIKLNSTDLQNVFDNDYIDGLLSAISRVSENEKNAPFRCFQHQSNTFYLFVEIDKENESKWEKATHSAINSFIDKITQKILELFKEWQDSQGDDIYTENGSRMYHKNVRKVMGGSLPREVSLSRLRSKIYNLWKTDIHSIT